MSKTMVTAELIPGVDKFVDEITNVLICENGI